MDATWIRRRYVVATAAVILITVPGFARAQARLEILPVETVTLTTQQILTGDKNGKPATLAGQLSLPTAGTDKLPAVLLLHGSGGLSDHDVQWARELNSIGIAAFMLDS